MEIVFEIIFQIICEVFIQVLFELGFHSLIEPLKKRPNALLAGIGYSIFGAIAGGISLFFFKQLFVIDPNLRIVNLFVTPIFAGLAMSLLGRLREKNGREVIRLDKFTYGFVFAFAMALTRFLSLS